MLTPEQIAEIEARDLETCGHVFREVVGRDASQDRAALLADWREMEAKMRTAMDVRLTWASDLYESGWGHGRRNIAELQAENRRLRAALHWYTGGPWPEHARAALGEDA